MGFFEELKSGQVLALPISASETNPRVSRHRAKNPQTALRLEVMAGYLSDRLANLQRRSRRSSPAEFKRPFATVNQICKNGLGD